MPAFDFALCLRMVGCAANVIHVLCSQILICQIQLETELKPLSLSRRGLWTIRGLSQPEAARARSSGTIGYVLRLHCRVHSFHAMI